MWNTAIKSMAVIMVAIFATSSVIAMAIEEPDFEVIESTDVFEIRKYQPQIVARTKILGTFEELLLF